MTTTQTQADAHAQHCCLQHGCKYNDDSCTVITKVSRQRHPCEFCPDVEEVEAELATLEDELRFQRQLRNVHPPDMRCGGCGDRLEPTKGQYVFGKLWDDEQWSWSSYTHAGAMLDRHGAWPVEPWEDD